MKKFLLWAVALIPIPALAQTGSTVREDRIWNYTLIHSLNFEGTSTSTSPNPGFHFEGTEDVNGKTYMAFRDRHGEILALMRQEGNKVYTPVMYKDIWPENIVNEVGYDNLPDEALLYDFDAQPGETYYCASYLSEITLVTVIESYKIEVNGEEYTVQRLEYDWQSGYQNQFTVVEGIGPSEWYLSMPLRSPLVTGLQTYLKIATVSDLYGNVVFSKDDYPTFNTDGIDSVTDSDSPVTYSNGSVVAEGMGIAVYDMAGKRVAQGYGSLSTASLQPGVYIVKAGASTLKITVK